MKENIIFLDCKIGIMQPYFLPYIGYFQLLNAVDKYVIYDDVNYINRGWINRNRILVNKTDKLITLKLNGASQNKLINEIEISDDKIYKNKLLKTIAESYRKAPFFSEVYPLIEEIINNDETKLSKYIEHSLKMICKYLEINTKIIVSSSLEKNNDLRAQEKVIHICKLLEGTEYYNAVGGQELYSFNDFKNNNIELCFLKTNNIEYKQFNNEFISNLSILDVMMFNSAENIKKMLDDFELIKE